MPAYIYPDESRDHLVTRTGHQTITGRKIFQSPDVGSTPLTVQGIVSQAADIFQWKNSAGTVLGWFRQDGAIFGPLFAPTRTNGTIRAFVGTHETEDTGIGIYSQSASSRVLLVRGTASQVGNIQEWQNSVGTVLTAIAPSGSMSVRSNGSQMSSALSVRGALGGATATNSVEWGHANGAGYGSSIGYNNSNGAAWIAFHGEAATTTANSFRTRGLRPMIVQMEPSTGWGSLQFMSVPSVSADDQTPFSAVAIQSAGSLFVNGHTNPTPVDSERFVVWASSNQTQGIIQARNSAGAAIMTVFPTYTQFYGNQYIDIGPNTQYGTYLRLTGGAFGGVVGRATISITSGNLHIDSASNGYGIYHSWSSPSTLGTIFGNGSGAEVGRMNAAGQFTCVSLTQTSRLDTKQEVERVLESGPDDEQLMRLSAVRYKSTLGPPSLQAPPLHSFIAEEVEEIMPELVTKDQDGEIVGIDVMALVTVLTTQVQNLTARIRELESK